MEDLNALRSYFATEKARKVEAYRRLNRYVKKGQIVFAGSSLMEQFPISELAQDLDLPYTIYNRGIGGYTTRELAEVLDVCVYALEPRILVLNIGTNDLAEDGYALGEMIERYEGILRDIYAHLPEVKLVLLAYYPGNAGAAMPYMAETMRRRSNERIREANAAVEALAGRVGAAYWDLNEGITGPDGALKAEYSIDGIHMYADGYYEVLKRLLPAFDALNDSQ